MGNSARCSGSTMSAKTFDDSRQPCVLSSGSEAVPAERAVIFNVGAVSIGGLDGAAWGAGPVVSFTLSADGCVPQYGQTATVGLATSAMLQKGFTFALDRDVLASAVLTLRVASGAQVLERAIPVRSLKYSGQKFFNETISFGMLQGPDRNSKSVPTVKLAFELLAVGDGKVHVAKQPHYMDLELASAPGRTSDGLRTRLPMG